MQHIHISKIPRPSQQRSKCPSRAIESTKGLGIARGAGRRRPECSWRGIGVGGTLGRRGADDPRHQPVSRSELPPPGAASANRKTKHGHDVKMTWSGCLRFSFGASLKRRILRPCTFGTPPATLLCRSPTHVHRACSFCQHSMVSIQILTFFMNAQPKRASLLSPDEILLPPCRAVQM